MRKKIKAVSLATGLFLSFSVNTSQDIQSTTYSYLKKQGLPLPGEGAKVVNDISAKIPGKLKEQKKEMQEKGYYTSDSGRPTELMQMKERANAIFAKTSQTELKPTAQQIPLGYQFNALPKNSGIDVTAFAPSGGYHNGWNGIVAFFEKEGLGSCAYTENNITLSQAAIYIPHHEAEYRVNGKLTLTEVGGSKDTGFLYTVHWFDERFFYRLECASIQYKMSLKNEVIALAKELDHRT
ncbi:MAG: hypothetical protein JJT82_03660 [Legionellaceae bacterium]|nr:hypothetical protein [Legionellaceae bacterium]